MPAATLAAPPGQGRGPSRTVHGLLFSAAPMPRRTAVFFASTSPNRPPPCPRATMSNSNSSSHALMAGSHTFWKQGWNARPGRDGTTRRAAKSAAQELIPDERVMNALHKMQDYLQQNHGRVPETGAENVYRTSRIKDKTEGCLHKWRRDFFKTLLDRQEEAQKHLNSLAAQLSQQNTATRSTQ